MATKRMMAACMVIGVMVMSVLSGMGMMGAEGEDGNFGGGDGTAGDPYAIEDVWDLQAMADDLTAHYVLINDIDASDTINWNEGTGFQPVGGELSSFEGVLDGQGHSISNLTINIMDENVGLFGSLGGDGEIKRIDLENVQVNGDTVVGGLVGYCEGAISDCSATGTVSGSKWVGGLVGSMDGSIDGCSAAVSVVGAQSLIGGLVGLISGWSKGDLTNCTASGDVSGNDTTGGLVGESYFGRIEGCRASGDVTGNEEVGGLVGSLTWSYVNICYATGDVSGKIDIGGLIGEISLANTVNNSYATGDVSGDENVGGLVGSHDGELMNSYATGKVTGDENVGGLVGYNFYSTVSNCFWDIQTSGKDESNGGIGKNTDRMKAINTFMDSSWNFITTWGIIEGVTYPYLLTHYQGPVISTYVPDNKEYTTEDEPYSMMVNSEVTSLPGCTNPPIWTMMTDCQWLSMDQSGLLSGTPSNVDVGVSWVNVTLRDPLLNTDTLNFTIEVLNVNDDPVISTVNMVSVKEDGFYHIDYNATDEDPTNDVLGWTLQTDATFLSMDSKTGILSGTPTNDEVGKWWVNISVTDGNGGLDWSNFTLTVINTNDLPVIIDVLPVNATEVKKGGTLVFSINASDEDGDALTITWKDGDVVLGTGSPLEYSQLGKGEHTITVVVDDGTGTVEDTLVVVVKEDKKSPGAGIVVIVLSMALAALVAETRKHP